MTGDAALAAFEQWGDLLRAADRDEGMPSGADAVAAIAQYALMVVDVAHRDLHDTFERILQRPEETILSTAERLRREGRTEGRTEGRAEMLSNLLTKRFGPLPGDVSARLTAASIADLDRWAVRVLDALSIADVFRDD